MKKLLILDIDETLIFSTYENLKREPDFYFKTRSVYIRPYLNQFLEYCFLKYDIAIWTSSRADYAKFILRKLVGDLGKFKFIWTRRHCKKIQVQGSIFKEEFYIKDLYKIKGYNIKNIAIIDDTPQNIKPYKNVFVISEYKGQETDKELKIILKQISLITRNLKQLDLHYWVEQSSIPDTTIDKKSFIVNLWNALENQLIQNQINYPLIKRITPNENNKKGISLKNTKDGLYYKILSFGEYNLVFGFEIRKYFYFGFKLEKDGQTCYADIPEFTKYKHIIAKINGEYKHNKWWLGYKRLSYDHLLSEQTTNKKIQLTNLKEINRFVIEISDIAVEYLKSFLKLTF